MLNDLLAIEHGLTARGISLASRHPEIKDMAKGRALRVRLARGGSLSSIEIIREAGNGTVWTLRDGQHNGFPSLKTASGLLSLDNQAVNAHTQAWNSDKTLLARRREVLSLFSTNSVDINQVAKWPSIGHRKRIAERLKALLSLTVDPLTAAVPATHERFLAALNLTLSFLEQLTIALEDRVRNGGDDWIEIAREALIGPFALAIDCEDLEFSRDACDPLQIEAVSVALSGRSSVESYQAMSGAICALSGKAARLHAGNFPQPNLPGLGQTYLFSRNKDIPSLTRYGRTADASFPIDSDLVRRLSSVITELTKESAKGLTWRLIPAETGDKPDLLVVGLSGSDIAIADALISDEEVGGKAALDEMASHVIKQSKGLVRHEKPEDVTVLILRTVDPANRKTIYHRRTSAKAFWKAAHSWKSATKNVPDWLGFCSPGQNKGEIVFRRPPYVSPLSLTSLSRMGFVSGGRRRINVIGTNVAEAFMLFLDEGDVVRPARRQIRLLWDRHIQLLSGLASAQRRGIDDLKGLDPKADLRRDALRSVTWIGALLYKLGREKEVYMSDAGFRLGQLLAAADVVHVGYCMDVRNGSIPPSLLGNALLGIAAERPHAALKLLLRRWPPYASWTKKSAAKIIAEAGNTEKGKAIALRRSLSQARRVGPIAAELCDQLRQDQGRMTDTFKAELLLGYMAGLPPVKKVNGADKEDDDIELGEGE